MTRLASLSCHLTEHHSTPLCIEPPPNLFLAVGAQRNERHRFGPLVCCLTLYHPHRLIEKIYMLDAISGGRLEMGVMRSISPSRLRSLKAKRMMKVVVPAGRFRRKQYQRWDTVAPQILIKH